MAKMLRILDETNEEVLSLATRGPAGFRMFELLQQAVRYIAPDIVVNGTVMQLTAYVIEGVTDSLLDYSDKYKIVVIRRGINFDVTYYMSTGPCGKDHFTMFI